jgi:hypothetical protein
MGVGQKDGGGIIEREKWDRKGKPQRRDRHRAENRNQKLNKLERLNELNEDNGIGNFVAG